MSLKSLPQKYKDIERFIVYLNGFCEINKYQKPLLCPKYLCQKPRTFNKKNLTTFWT